MSLFYVHLEADNTVLDADGVSLPNLSAAHAYAVRIARELTHNSADFFGRSWSQCTMLVYDEIGTEVLSLPMARFSGD